jgi:Cupin domain
VYVRWRNGIVKLYAAVPRELVGGWEQSIETLSADQAVGFHYHEVEEWLTVITGEMTFFTLADEPFHVKVEQALCIPRGEVHRVEAGPEGVQYAMLLPVAVSPERPFKMELTTDELEAFRRNLEFPDYEDGRVENGREFFKNALSKKLVFCRANGECISRRRFIEEAFVDKGRSSDGSVRVLNNTDKGLLFSTVVKMNDAGSVRSFANIRFLERKTGDLRCRLWANYEQFAPD